MWDQYLSKNIKWKHGSMVPIPLKNIRGFLKNKKPRNHKSLQPRNQESLKSRNQEILKPSNQETNNPEPKNPETRKLLYAQVIFSFIVTWNAPGRDSASEGFSLKMEIPHQMRSGRNVILKPLLHDYIHAYHILSFAYWCQCAPTQTDTHMPINCSRKWVRLVSSNTRKE